MKSSVPVNMLVLCEGKMLAIKLEKTSQNCNKKFELELAVIRDLLQLCFPVVWPPATRHHEGNLDR